MHHALATLVDSLLSVILVQDRSPSNYMICFEVDLVAYILFYVWGF